LLQNGVPIEWRKFLMLKLLKHRVYSRKSSEQYTE